MNVSNKPGLVKKFKRYVAWLPLFLFLILVVFVIAYRNISQKDPIATVEDSDLDCATFCDGFLECVANYQPMLHNIRNTDRWDGIHSACQAGCQKQKTLATACARDIAAGRCDSAQACLENIMRGATPQ